MAKRSNSNIVEEKAGNFSLLSSVWGIIVSGITILSLGFGIGWYFGQADSREQYKALIEDYRFEKIQMQLDFQVKLREEKEKWELNHQNMISLEELQLFFASPIKTVKSNEK